MTWTGDGLHTSRAVAYLIGFHTPEMFERGSYTTYRSHTLHELGNYAWLFVYMITLLF